MKPIDVYLYGMTVLSTLHRLDGAYPDADAYQEIKETHIVPGGETANSAIVLAKYGLKTKIDGPFLGTKTKEGIVNFLENRGIDCAGLHYDPSFEGVQDLVLIDQCSRTVFGKFQHFFSGEKRWTAPDRNAIRAAQIVALDPFFGEESAQTAEYCLAEHKKYVTIDCPPDNLLHQNAAATVISNEYLKNQFPNADISAFMKEYTESSKGLTIFTFGAREILYGRKGRMERIIPYKVEVKSTLGAGDTFRAGVVYGVFQNWDDEKIVKFAAATAASVCTRFPMALDPPGLDEVLELMNS